MLCRLTLAVLTCLCLAGCGKDDPPPTPDSGTPSGDVRVSPGDRLGWMQSTADSSDISAIQFALYIDGVRTVLAGVACAQSGANFECSAVLPAMTAGTHTLELASFVADGGATLESARSEGLRVVAAAADTSVAATSTLVVTAEKVRLNLTRVVEGLNLPSDLAFASDGTIFVAERGGLVRVLKDGVLATPPALDLTRDVRLPEGGLLALSLDRNFDVSGIVYTLYAAAAPRDGQEFVVARYRSVDGIFGEPSVLLDRTPASPHGASGALRVGGDDKLYVALDSSADGRIAGSFATYNGKVLRFNMDATTPDDQPGSTPVYSLEHPQPTAMDWQPGSGHLWVVDRVGADSGRLSAVTGDSRQKRAAFRTAYTLPAGTGATSTAFYRGELMPMFKGNLFVAAEVARQLIRLRFDPDDSLRIVSVERLLGDAIGAVRVVAQGPDGALYIATESALYRLAP